MTVLFVCLKKQRGLFKHVQFLEALMWKTKEKPTIFLEVLENKDFLEMLEIASVKRPLS